MKIHKGLKHNNITVDVQTFDDLWTLSKIIEPFDSLSGQTQRKIKVGDAATDRNVKVTKKWMKLTITAEKIEYEPALEVLRVTGKITDGPEDVAHGDYHSFSIVPQSSITITKSWRTYQIKKLEDAQNATHSTILIALIDRENALIGSLSDQGFLLKKRLKGDVEKKFEGSTGKEDFFQTVAKLIAESKPQTLVVGTSHFWQSKLKLAFEAVGLKPQFVENDTVSLAEVDSLIASKEFSQVVSDNIHAKQSNLFETVLIKINEDLATYGIDQVQSALNTGAVESILISNQLIKLKKEKDEFAELDSLLELADQQKVQTHLIENESPIIKQLDGIGGIAAILRYKI